MQVVTCPECGGYVALDSKRCQNCGHWMNPTTASELPKAAERSSTRRRSRFQEDMKSPRKVAFFVVCIIVFFVLIAVAVFFALGGGHSPEIKFIADGGSYMVTVTYLDGNGIHQAQYSRSGHFEWKVTGASSANMILMSDTAASVTGKAYVDDRLVDQQSGTYVMISATP